MTRQPRYQNSGGSKLLFFCEIGLIAAAFYGAARIDLDFEPSLFFLYEGGLERLSLVAATILLAMYFHHLYADVRVRSRVLLLQQLCEVFGIALVAQSLVVYLKPDWILPRWLMIYGVLFSLVAIFIWRVVYSQFVLNIIRRHRMVFVGRNQTVRESAHEIASTPGWGYEILGYMAGVRPPSIAKERRASTWARAVVSRVWPARCVRIASWWALKTAATARP